jgi:hypothetical protein
MYGFLEKRRFRMRRAGLMELSQVMPMNRILSVRIPGIFSTGKLCLVVLRARHVTSWPISLNPEIMFRVAMDPPSLGG